MAEKRVVGIRGLDQQIYEQIQDLARKKNENVANIINEALTKYLQNTDDVEYTAPQTISGQSAFEITAEALTQLTPLRIEDVNTVIILDDNKEITTDMIEKDLESIVRVQQIFVPSRLYYVILKKSKNVNEVIKYNPPWKEEIPLNFGANAKLNYKMLEKFDKENKRLKITVTGGDLLIENDISVEMFEEMITELKVKGNLIVPEGLYASVLTKGTIEGSVQLTDKEGKIFDQIQFGNVSGSKSESSSTRKDSKTKSPFTFTFNPGMDTLFDSIEEIKDGIAKTLQNLNIDAELSDRINEEIQKDLRKEKKDIKKKHRVKPTKIQKKGEYNSEDDDDDDDTDYKIDIE